MSWVCTLLLSVEASCCLAPGCGKCCCWLLTWLLPCPPPWSIPSFSLWLLLAMAPCYCHLLGCTVNILQPRCLPHCPLSLCQWVDVYLLGVYVNATVAFASAYLGYVASLATVPTIHVFESTELCCMSGIFTTIANSTSRASIFFLFLVLPLLPLGSLKIGFSTELNSFQFLSTTYSAFAVSNAFWKVNVDSDSNLFWVFSSVIPQTSLSLCMSSRTVLKLQCVPLGFWAPPCTLLLFPLFLNAWMKQEMLHNDGWLWLIVLLQCLAYVLEGFRCWFSGARSLFNNS